MNDDKAVEEMKIFFADFKMLATKKLMLANVKS